MEVGESLEDMDKHRFRKLVRGNTHVCVWMHGPV